MEVASGQPWYVVLAVSLMGGVYAFTRFLRMIRKDGTEASVDALAKKASEIYTDLTEVMEKKVVALHEEVDLLSKKLVATQLELTAANSSRVDLRMEISEKDEIIRVQGEELRAVNGRLDEALKRIAALEGLLHANEIRQPND